jgi:GNAT superfamily N-acetyltransferase
VSITVRPARLADVPAMSRVMTASVTELCSLDHHDDPANIAAWVSNRTPDGVAKMLARPAQRFYVAESENEIAAVGAVNDEGVVIFNYVSPAHRFRGVSSTLLAALETDLKKVGHREGRLTSTTTAHRFYLSRGWIDDGPPEVDGFSTSYPMRKTL